MAKKHYTYFEDVYDDPKPYVFKDLALVAYEYDRMFKKYRVYGYDYIPKEVGFYLGGGLVSTDLKANEVKEIKKHIQSVHCDKDGVLDYWRPKARTKSSDVVETDVIML